MTQTAEQRFACWFEIESLKISVSLDNRTKMDFFE